MASASHTKLETGELADEKVDAGNRASPSKISW